MTLRKQRTEKAIGFFEWKCDDCGAAVSTPKVCRRPIRRRCNCGKYWFFKPQGETGAVVLDKKKPPQMQTFDQEQPPPDEPPAMTTDAAATEPDE